MIIATAHLKSAGEYGQNAMLMSERNANEDYKAFEERCWLERCHYDEKEGMWIPPMAFKNAIAEAARFMSLKIEGKRNATWTKHFEAGVLVIGKVFLGVKWDQITKFPMHVPSDGKRGGSSKVLKFFPVINAWEATVPYYIFDEEITQKIFERHLQASGVLIGVGWFRPRNNGFYGRFDVKKVDWVKQAD
jgi:hypothetical protein